MVNAEQGTEDFARVHSTYEINCKLTFLKQGLKEPGKPTLLLPSILEMRTTSKVGAN